MSFHQYDWPAAAGPSWRDDESIGLTRAERWLLLIGAMVVSLGIGEFAAAIVTGVEALLGTFFVTAVVATVLAMVLEALVGRRLLQDHFQDLTNFRDRSTIRRQLFSSAALKSAAHSARLPVIRSRYWWVAFLAIPLVVVGVALAVQAAV